MIKKLQSYILLIFTVIVFAKANASCIAISSCWNNQSNLASYVSIHQNKEKQSSLPCFTDSINFEEVEEDEGDEKTKRLGLEDYSSSHFFRLPIVLNFIDNTYFNKFSKSYLSSNRRQYILNNVFRI
jgi:hypothetical protein